MMRWWTVASLQQVPSRQRAEWLGLKSRTKPVVMKAHCRTLGPASQWVDTSCSSFDQLVDDTDKVARRRADLGLNQLSRPFSCTSSATSFQ